MNPLSTVLTSAVAIILSFFFGKKKSNTEVEKYKAEIEKLKADAENVHSDTTAKELANLRTAIGFYKEIAGDLQAELRKMQEKVGELMFENTRLLERVEKFELMFNKN